MSRMDDLHITAIREATAPATGRSHQTVCVTCDYKGPHLPERNVRRLSAIGTEHVRRMAGQVVTVI